MKRTLLVLALATIGAGGTAAQDSKSQDSKSQDSKLQDTKSKVTLVYEHTLPNVPGKSIKVVLVEYEPGGSSPAHTHANSAFI
jgi:quercetin dioxygenase-like cupin family protein